MSCSARTTGVAGAGGGDTTFATPVGWLGGAAYLALVVVTLMLGLIAAPMQTPWQYYLITAYGVFVGEAFEGMIVDTDHWRHFFLLLGLVCNSRWARRTVVP